MAEPKWAQGLSRSDLVKAVVEAREVASALREIVVDDNRALLKSTGHCFDDPPTLPWDESTNETSP